MKRVYAALATAVILVALIPATAAAGRVTKSTEQYVFVGCDAPIDGGFVSVFLDHNTEAEFSFLAANIWFDPDTPFESDPTVSGSTETVDLTDDGTTIEVSSSFPVFDLDGNELGTADVEITVARNGQQTLIEPQPGKTNQNDKSTGIEEGLEGSGTLTFDGSEIPVDLCSGVVGDINVFRTNPSTLVTANSGIFINCFWQEEEDSTEASFFASVDTFGSSADAFLLTPEVNLVTMGQQSFSLTSAGVAVELEMVDFETEEPHTANAVASFTRIGGPVNSTLLGQTFQTRLNEQPFAPSGTLEFSTGDSFEMDAEHCLAVQFKNRSATHKLGGPKSGPVPANDGPEDAIQLTSGSRRNDRNAGAASDPEFPILTCPEGEFDDFGRTLWYTIEGTGEPVTVDTAGSNIDTLIGVYVPTAEGFEEIACIDDVFFDPSAPPTRPP